MKKTLGRLPDGTTGLVFGDVPTNNGNPVQCLKKHKERYLGMRACRRESLAKRTKEAALREAALETGHLSGNLYDKVCSYDPCPLVQGDVLMWRDSGHLTKTFVKRLTPSWRTLLSEAITEIGTAAETDSLVALDAEDGADLP